MKQFGISAECSSRFCIQSTFSKLAEFTAISQWQMLSTKFNTHSSHLPSWSCIGELGGTPTPKQEPIVSSQHVSKCTHHKSLQTLYYDHPMVLIWSSMTRSFQSHLKIKVIFKSRSIISQILSVWI